MLLLLFTACMGTLPAAGDGTGDIAGTYSEGWPIGTCQNDVSGTEGFLEGDVIPDYTMKAQTGENVRLYDFCNQVVYIELGYFT